MDSYQPAQAGRHPHDPATRITALAHYANTGCVRESARATGLAESTLRAWVDTEEGVSVVAHIRAKLRAAIANDLADVAKRGVQVMLERLERGDPVLGPGGEIVYRGVSGKDAAYITTQAVTQHQILTAESASAPVASLKGVAAELVAELRKVRGVQAQTIDAEVVGEVRSVSATAETTSQPSQKRRAKARRQGEGGSSERKLS